jgi:murein tripeptide amidase MpaA
MSIRSAVPAVAVVAFGLSLALTGCDSSTGPNERDGAPDIRLFTDFEGASLGSWDRVTPTIFNLTIRKDTNSEFARWYSFRVRGGRGEALRFHITNAAEVSAAGAWPFNRPVVSSDGGLTWARISSTLYEGGVFTFEHTPASNDEWIALNPVYNYSRWTNLADEISTHPMVDTLVVLTHTLQGRPFHLVKITDASVPDTEKGAVWGTARQHPAEVAGSWMAEGLIDWLLGEDPQAVELRRKAIFYLMPFLNPDGVALGNYRVNSVGMNLNREWTNRNPANAPTVAAAAQAMEEFVASGQRFEFFVDFHAYSSLRKNFFFYSGRDRAPEEEVQEIEDLMDLFQSINGDFTRSGSIPSGDDARLARGWAFESFGVQAVTFEASYQDVTYGPFAFQYMTPERYLALGEGLGRSLAELFFGVAL